jgi:hypothetical protein
MILELRQPRYIAIIPASMWSLTRQRYMQVPMFSGTVLAVTICAGESSTTSVREPFTVTTLLSRVDLPHPLHGLPIGFSDFTLV